ncbi:MAG: hypothetical protein ABL921_12545 [Pirellula sp.]
MNFIIAIAQARLPGVTNIEANTRQIIPVANKAWESRFPGMFQITDGPTNRRANQTRTRRVNLCRVERARRKQSLKEGGEHQRVELADIEPSSATANLSAMISTRQ